jgi:CDP-diacylglycerol--glycerol-3-phosphate 3-phosphatidyltransferase
VQRLGYRAIEPLGRALARAGVSANAVTLASVPFAVAAATAFARERYGVAALLAGACFACDALDGMIARATGTASDAGEVLDSVCDRICEAMLLGGIAVAWRASAALLVLVVVAGLGAQQVTLASAKAAVFPAAGRRVPRGLMRRVERAVYLVGGAALAAILADALGPGASPAAVRAPLVFALLLFAVIGNASALHRFVLLSRALRSEEVNHAGRR